MTKREANQQLVSLGFSNLKVEKYPFGWKLVDVSMCRQDFRLRRRITECVAAAKRGELPAALPVVKNV